MRGSQPAIAGFEHGWWVPLTKEGGQPPEARNSVWPTAIKKSGISDIQAQEWNTSNNPKEQETDFPQGPPESNTGEKNIGDQHLDFSPGTVPDFWSSEL